MKPNSGTCPSLVPMMADQLCLYPASVYCRPPDGRIRVPALDTLARLCTADYTRCARYRGETTAEKAAAHGLSV